MLAASAPSRHPLPRRLPGRALATLLLAVLVGACQPPVNRPTAPQIGAPPSLPGAQPTPVEPVGPPQRIGLLVPLTGNAAAVGKDLQRAAELAVLERGSDRLELLPRDTASTQAGAVAAARQLLDQERVGVILGPLFGSSAERVAELARPRGVMVLSFSSQGAIAGDGLFVLGYRPEEQVERVVDFALGRGYSRIAALAPDDAYGRGAVQSLEALLARRPGAEFTDAAYYGQDGANAAAAMQRLRGRSQGLPPFDALLVADGGDRLRRVSAQLPQHGIEPVDVRMLGTMLWADDPAALQEPALRGGWFPGIADAATREFNARFRRLFGRDPHPLAILGYDGVLIAADAAANPATARQRLVDGRGYQGEAGIIRLTPAGVAEHGLAVFELTAGGPVIVEPAPVRFPGPEPTS